MGKGDNIYNYLDHLAKINHKQLETIREFETKIHNLLDNKHRIHAQLIPLMQKVSSNSKYLSQMNQISLKIQTELTVNLTQLVNSTKQKSGLLQREIITISEFNKALKQNYSAYKIASIHPALDNTKAQEKAGKIASNINFSINEFSHVENLNEYSKKLISKLNSLIEKKSAIINTKINIIKYCSKTNLENLDKNLKNLAKIQVYIIQLSEKLEETINQMQSEFLEPYTNLVNDKKVVLKNTYKSLNQNHFIKAKTNLLTKKEVLHDLKSINSESNLKDYIMALTPCINTSFIEKEVEDFLINQKFY